MADVRGQIGGRKGLSRWRGRRRCQKDAAVCFRLSPPFFLLGSTVRIIHTFAQVLWSNIRRPPSSAHHGSQIPPARPRPGKAHSVIYPSNYFLQTCITC